MFLIIFVLCKICVLSLYFYTLQPKSQIKKPIKTVSSANHKLDHYKKLGFAKVPLPPGVKSPLWERFLVKEASAVCSQCFKFFRMETHPGKTGFQINKDMIEHSTLKQV